MRSRASRQIFRGLFFGIALSASVAPSPIFAQDAAPMEVAATLPVPRVVIYPGDTIRDDMLMDVPANEAQGVINSTIQMRSGLVGKMARRTLLPGKAVSSIAISNPRAVVNGAEVR